MRRSSEDIERILSGEEYESEEEAIAAARALVGDDMAIVIHGADCTIDDKDAACSCVPVIVVKGERGSA